MTMLRQVAVCCGAFLLGFVLVFLLGACEERVAEQEDWQVDPNALRFAPAPQCPSPGTPAAASYQEHGGASNALLWFMLMHSLDSPSIHEVHHYHYDPAPSWRSYRVVRTTLPKATSWTQKTSSAPMRVVPKSASYGFRPSAAKPASTSFRPSTVRVRTR